MSLVCCCLTCVFRRGKLGWRRIKLEMEWNERGGDGEQREMEIMEGDLVPQCRLRVSEIFRKESLAGGRLRMATTLG